MKDNSQVKKMPAALNNRFLHLQYENKAEYWKKYAAANGIDERLIGFAEFRSNICDNPDLNANAFCTWRSLTACNDLLDAPREIRFKLLKGAIGNGAATELQSFLTLQENLPPLQSMIDNPKTCQLPDPSKRDLTVAVVQALAKAATPANFGAIAEIFNRLPGDFTEMGFAAATLRDPKLKQSHAYIQHEIDGVND